MSEKIILFIINSIIVLAINTKSYNVAKKFNLLDYPSKNKIHVLPTPFVGGIIIYLLLFTCFVTSVLSNFDLNTYLFFYISAFFVLGLIDDKFNLNSYHKILLVFLISILFIFLDDSFLIHKIFFSISNTEYYFGKLKIPVTIICILLLYVSMNMSDGINCLLISFTATLLILINILVLKRNLGYIDISLLSSLTTLLYFNYKNKIFLGNAGANLLCAYFIYILINSNYYSSIDVFEVISVFLIMGIDMVRLIFIRLFNKLNPFDRDLNHFHHILSKKFNVEITIVVYLILSFMPLILHYLSSISTVVYIPIQILIYSIIIYKLR